MSSKKERRINFLLSVIIYGILFAPFILLFFEGAPRGIAFLWLLIYFFLAYLEFVKKHPTIGWLLFFLGISRL